jgi:hypothetical protein
MAPYPFLDDGIADGEPQVAGSFTGRRSLVVGELVGCLIVAGRYHQAESEDF